MGKIDNKKQQNLLFDVFLIRIKNWQYDHRT